MTIEIIQCRELSSSLVLLFKATGGMVPTYEIIWIKQGDDAQISAVKVGEKEPVAMECLEFQDTRSGSSIQALLVVRDDADKLILEIVKVREKKLKSLMYLADPGSMA